jgi:hypothetical protein
MEAAAEAGVEVVGGVSLEAADHGGRLAGILRAVGRVGMGQILMLRAPVLVLGHECHLEEGRWVCHPDQGRKDDQCHMAPSSLVDEMIGSIRHTSMTMLMVWLRIC